ncbi:polyprenol monophosphomannose synthase [Candidatus Desantisbacteria bacterium]|nr:polyprenol monophosphomannose synthase [Candidatus Desantisbacteria bacterium]
MKPIVVIPTYNEQENIRKLVEIILKLEPQFSIIIVDDNSPDGTGKIADELKNENPGRVYVIHRPGKMGLGRAYIDGFKYALSLDADYIFEMDADFSHSPEKLPVFLKEMQDADIVIGSRYINGVSVINWPLRRLFLSVLASYYVRFITGMNLHDNTTGFKCFKRKVLENIKLDSIDSDGYSFQIEMNYRAIKKGFKIKEVPIIFIDRHSGSSKMSKAIIREAIIMVWKLKFGLYKK